MNPSTADGAAVKLIGEPANRTAPSVGLTKATLGGRACTCTVTGCEMAVAKRLSVACAVREWLPAVKLDQTIENGGAVSRPMDWPSTKNSTWATEPSLSFAVAARVTSIAWPKVESA